MRLEQIFNRTTTENGDACFANVGNPFMDILFKAEYFRSHLNEVSISDTIVDKLFAMFMRDPRYGLGQRELGRHLMYLSGVSFQDIIKAGRYDDLWSLYWHTSKRNEVFDFLKKEIENGNELCKKWMPRYSSRNLMIAREIAKYWGMNKQQYGHFIKCDTVENKLSRKNYDEIKFENVPSLAMLKYSGKCFVRKAELKERYAAYLRDVKAGKAELHVSTTSVYDIYRNRERIDADLFFDKIEKISGSWIPIVDSSSSMKDSNDSYGKAMAVGHYLAKCSTYAPNKVLSFSSHPQLIELGVTHPVGVRGRSCWYPDPNKSQYNNEINSLHTGDVSHTDFGAVCEKLKELGTDAPEFIIVLSDMQFDAGSETRKDEMMRIFKENGMNTKIVWWNFNSRSATCPETDAYGNIFMSGYSPMLLRYLKAGFDGIEFMQTLLLEYAKNINFGEQ